MSHDPERTRGSPTPFLPLLVRFLASSASFPPISMLLSYPLSSVSLSLTGSDYIIETSETNLPGY